MNLATTAANSPVATGKFVSGRLSLPPVVHHLIEHNRIIATGSAVTDGWRSYLIAPSRADVIVRRGVRVSATSKELSEKDFDAAMIWTMFEAGVVLELAVKDGRIKFPPELAHRCSYPKVWFLPFSDYTVATTIEADVDGFADPGRDRRLQSVGTRG